jgi:hypothetical protein
MRAAESAAVCAPPPGRSGYWLLATDDRTALPLQRCSAMENHDENLPVPSKGTADGAGRWVGPRPRVTAGEIAAVACFCPLLDFEDTGTDCTMEVC